MAQAQEKIAVKMFGGISIRIGERSVSETEGRTKKVWLLVEFLLANRQNDVSLEKFIEAIWEDEEFEDPINALKNLVYRARKLLRRLDENIEFIRFARNTYVWNNELECEIDTEQFEQCCKSS